MTFRLHDQLYAIEHTGFAPFVGFMAHQNRAADLFAPIDAAVASALGAMLGPGAVFELHVPIDSLTGRKMLDVRAIQAVNWIAATMPTLPVRRYADYPGTLITALLDGVPSVW